MAFTVAILTVSDTAAQGVAADLTGPALADHALLRGAAFCLSRSEVVPDDIDIIRRSVREFADRDHISLILTAGGTGCGPRDQTPEAVSAIVERSTPGITHAMLSASLAITPFACLARPFSGIRAETLIICLPGSPKAASECLSALQPALPHALQLIAGESGEAVHRSLGAPSPAMRRSWVTGHQHVHSGHSTGTHAPERMTMPHRSAEGVPVSARHRASPFPIVPLDEAFGMIFEHCQPGAPIRLPVNSSLVGHALAEDAKAPTDLPRSPTSNVDGYAVEAPLAAGLYPVVSSAVQSTDRDSARATAFRINTGAALPKGTNAVIMVEDTALDSAEPDGEEANIQTLADARPGANVRQMGSDVWASETVLQRGQVFSAVGGEIGTLAFIGSRDVLVHSLPRVGVISTGDELIELEDTQAVAGGYSSGVFDSNRPSAVGVLSSHHFPVQDHGIVRDNRVATADALRKVAAVSDVIVTSGGTSMGEADFLKPVIEHDLGGTIHFGRVAMKPGLPTTFATIPIDQENGAKRQVAIFALPGNPASCLVTLQVFVLPALRKMGGYPAFQWHSPTVQVKVSSYETRCKAQEANR